METTTPMTDEEREQARIERLDREAAEAYEEDDVIDAVTGGAPTFNVMDERSADWVLNKMTSWQEEIERVELAAKARVNRLKNKIEWFKRRFAGDLELYAIAALTDSRAKSKKVTLPCGVPLYFRRVPEDLKVVNEAETVAWAKQFLPNAVVEHEPTIAAKEVKDYFKAVGEIPPGTLRSEAYEKFYIGTFK